MNEYGKILPAYKKYKRYPSDYEQGYADGYNECLDDFIYKFKKAEPESGIDKIINKKNRLHLLT